MKSVSIQWDENGVLPEQDSRVYLDMLGALQAEKITPRLSNWQTMLLVPSSDTLQA